MLLTDWQKVAVVGQTIDGRKLDPVWLTSMAKTYKREDYIASLNTDHWFPGGLGTVHELKMGKDEQGREALFARIQPEAEFLYRVKNGWNVFYSVEVRHDFPEKGQHYLSGLAITDRPASLGLQPTKFSKSAEESFSRLEAVPANLNGETPTPQEEEPAQPEKMSAQKPEPEPEPEQPPGWFQSFLAKINWPNGATDTPTKMENDPMTKEEQAAFNAIQESVKELTAAVAELTAGANKPPADDPKAPAPETPEATKAAAQPGPETAQLAEFKAGLETITGGLAELQKKFTAFEGFMAQTTETEALNTTGDSEGEQEIY